MNPTKLSRRLVLSILGVAFVAGVLFLFSPLLAQAKGKSSRPDSKKQEATVVKKPDWKRVEALIEEQKFEEARKEVEGLRKISQAAADNTNWTKALVREVQLEIGLSGFENAVRFLRTQPWPDAPESRIVLSLFYAHSLTTYARAYSWEINKREKVESKNEVDLKAWTRDQIYEEAQKGFLEAWRVREKLSGVPAAKYGEFLTGNTYPAGIRSSMRDALSYMFVELYADTSFWRPEQSNDLFRLNKKALLAGNPESSAKVKLENQEEHPLVKIGAILDDLSVWHGSRDEKEAQLEAYLERLRRWRASFTEPEDRKFAIKQLSSKLEMFRDKPWWAMGQADLSDLVREEDRADSIIQSRQLAQEGVKAYPDSPGGQRCAHIIRAIDAPDYELASMSSDGTGKRSLLVLHKNFPKLYFRAYKNDLKAWIGTRRDYNLLPSPEEIRKIMARPGKPAAEWSAALPETRDFRTHKTFVVPPMKEPGATIIVASMRPDFAESSNKVLGVHLLFGDLVLTTRTDNTGGYIINTFSGATGTPVGGAKVHLYRLDWQAGHKIIDTKTTGENGEAVFSIDPTKEGSSHFALAEKGNDIAVDLNWLGFSKPYEPSQTSSALVFTDRSIYRPQQKIFWKAIAYRGNAKDAVYKVIPEMAFTVWLIDPNGQRVESVTTKSNTYGSAAGEFVIPTGRLLGNWRIDTSLGGSAGIGVEEYKRPTFEVEFQEIKDPLRLNKPVNLEGEAKYYFGLPVTAGQVKWRVTREPVYPWWWGFWGFGPRAGSQIVATGASTLDEKGIFKVSFTPEVEEPKDAAGKETTYRYRVSADITDEGGETRSADKSLRIGFVSVDATLAVPAGFAQAGEPVEIHVYRRNLDGTPKAGKASWNLFKLSQPAAQVPSEIPVFKRPAAGDNEEEIAGDNPYETPGDKLRSRWETGVTPELLFRTWKEGAGVGSGALSHDDKGDAIAKLGKLDVGVYRLKYQTLDEFGATYETAREFVVAGEQTWLGVPLLVRAQETGVEVGKKARILAVSGLPNQLLYFDIYRDGKLRERRVLKAGSAASVVEIPITEADRGGFGVIVSGLRDHQFFQSSTSISVPWDNKNLSVEFSSFRDRLRPGGKETWTVTVKNPSGKPVEKDSAELLAYMYDRSLDIFRAHTPPSVFGLYPWRGATSWVRASLGQANANWILGQMPGLPGYPSFSPDRLTFFDRYGIGGPGSRSRNGRMMKMAVRRANGAEAEEMAPPPAPMAAAPSMQLAEAKAVSANVGLAGVAGGVGKKDQPAKEVDALDDAEPAPSKEPVPLRSNFAETAFWKPNLLTNADGSASFEFTVPDSVTSWNVWVHALTRDLRGGSVKKETRSVKDLMVRPYVPRFLREGDEADLKVVVNNASDAPLTGQLELEVIDPETQKSLLGEFGLTSGMSSQPFTVAAGGGSNFTFKLKTPKKVGVVAFKVTARSGNLSDGELRPLPVLPSRYHLVQSRFVTLRNKDRKVMTFEDLAKEDDPSRINEQMVVTVDAQLFYTVLGALPYLIDYPYECTEQTLNRFVSTGIVTSVFDQFPAVAKMAKELSKRDSVLEKFDEPDPNRKMTLEESPWLIEAKGGQDAGFGMTKALDPAVSKATREAALARLKKAQTSNGGFPWFPGGPPSPYMTLYIMHGFAKAAEFGVDVPKDVVQRGWQYLGSHFRGDLRKMMADDCCWEFLTFLNYVASSYPDPSWVNGAISDADRKDILNFSFKHWKQHSPYLKGYLTLTLKRMGRPKDAKLVWDSVMDSAKTNEEQGTFWAREDRSWLWYNDTIESHAFSLRTLMELDPKDSRRDGLVQWLLLNKKLNQWKSTRATAEVIYSLVHYLKAEGALGIREDARVTIGNQKVEFVFEPDRYTGKKNQILVPGEKVDPKTTSTVVVEKESKGFVFASATWHFSTEKLPAEDRGDFFQVSRKYFLRENTGREWVLKPLAEGAVLKPGDQVEVQVSLRTKHEAEYVHLRDPRAAGLEPENAVSRFKWDLGIGYYEEIRDSGTNFFFERLPVGEYTFKYRLRANMGGTFRIGPATVQSMYAPEFNAYSAGFVLQVSEGEPVRQSGK